MIMRRKRYFSLILGFLFFQAISLRGATELPAKENFHLFLLVGQSNMAGRGKVTPADKKPHPRVLMLKKAGQWVPAADPLHFDKPRMVGVGLGKTFGTLVAQKSPEVTVGLIPCAHGGSPISVWQPGRYYKPTRGHPWDDAIKRSKLAMKAGTLKGILWHQGESDSKAGLAEAYEKKLHDLVARFRKELDAREAPFLAGQMGIFKERPWSDAKKRVDQAHRELPKKLKHAGFVGAKGLDHKGDQTHFDASSYRELGRRYADVFFKLTSDPSN